VSGNGRFRLPKQLVKPLGAMEFSKYFERSESQRMVLQIAAPGWLSTLVSGSQL
jgi:hypothetical protein